MKNKSIVKNYVYNILYQVLVLLTPLVTTPYISRVLGAYNIGIFAFAQSITTYFILIGCMGSSLFAQREVAYVQDSIIEQSKNFVKIIRLRMGAIGVISIIYFCVFCIHGEYKKIYLILIIELLATMFDITWFFQGIEEFKTIVIRNTLVKIVGIILVFCTVKTEEDLALYACCVTIPVLVGNFSLWFSLPKYICKVKVKYIDSINLLKPILILFIPQIAKDVYTVLDKTMLGVLASSMVENGYYVQTQKIVKLCLQIVTSLGIVMLPTISAAYAQGKIDEIHNKIEKSFRYVFLIGSPLTLGLASISEILVPWFFGSGYSKVSILIAISSPIILIIGISNVIGVQYLLPTKQQKYYTISVVAGAITNFILNLFLIKWLDSVGASIATVLAEGVVTSIQIYAVRKQVPVFKYLKKCQKYVWLSIMMGTMIWLVNDYLVASLFSIITVVFIACSFYIGVLYIMKDEMLYKVINEVKKKVISKRGDK